MTDQNQRNSFSYQSSIEEEITDYSSASETPANDKKFQFDPISLKKRNSEQRSDDDDDDDHSSDYKKLNHSESTNGENKNDSLEQPLGHSNSNEETNQIKERHPTCQFKSDKTWIDCQYHDSEHTSIKKPNEIENEMEDPPVNYNEDILDRIQGSMFGMALGDALGAHVEFRPREYLNDKPVEDLQGGGTWGLQKGQFTDDTSMALCLANSLIARQDFNCYDQLVRYRWWHINGYMSSTGKCFDIGAATCQSLEEFARRQNIFAEENHIPINDLDFLSDVHLLQNFDVFCSKDGVAGNGALMRLAPVPLFFYQNPVQAVELSGISGKITHGDQKADDACRYYGALIVAALNGETKEQLLDNDFYLKHQHWFNEKTLHPDIMNITQGSYKKQGGYDEGIRGKGYIVDALEAALWAFWSDDDSFKKGVLAAVNLGDDTDTTAAIYGQLAGAYYGYHNLPSEWLEQVYAKKFIETVCKWIAYEGERRKTEYTPISPTPIVPELLNDPDTETTTSTDESLPNDQEVIPSTTPKYVEVQDDQSSATTTSADESSPNEQEVTPPTTPKHVKVQDDQSSATTTADDVKLQNDQDMTSSTTSEDVKLQNNHESTSPSIPEIAKLQSDQEETPPTTPKHVKVQDDQSSATTTAEDQDMTSSTTSEDVKLQKNHEPTSPSTPETTRPQSDQEETPPTTPDIVKQQVDRNAVTSTIPEDVSREDHQNIRLTTPDNEKSQNSFTSIPISPQTPTFNLHTIHKYNETSEFSPRNSDRISVREPSYESESYRSNPTYYSPANNKESLPMSKTTETRTDTRAYNVWENTNANRSYSHELPSYSSSTNKPSNLNKNLLFWTVNDVCCWLQAFGENYSIYADSFRKDFIDGFRLYNFINDQLLIDYGVKNEGHRQRILDAIQQIRKDFINERRRPWYL